MGVHGLSLYSRIIYFCVNLCAGQREVRAKSIKVDLETIFQMFIHRKAQLGLAKVLAFLLIFITCVSPPLAVADDRSVIPAARPGSVRRLPNLSFRVIEGSNHGRLPAEAHAVPHRRSHYRGVNKEENYVLRRVPVYSARRHAHHGKTGQKESHKENENKNTNLNLNHGSVTPIEKSGIFLGIIHNEEKPEKETSISKLEVKLHSSITFRFNIITVFGQLLKASDNRLTVDQYTSLNLILQAVSHKLVYMFNILPVLKKLQNANRKNQFKLVILALMNNVPVYLTSACKFWVHEIDKHRIDIENITESIEHPADFLAGIDPAVIDTCKVKVAAEELEPDDELSKFTEVTLGPVFVNIFDKLKKHQIKLSQKIFGAILANLPVGKLNPVFEEYINYIYDVAQENSLPNWPDIATKIEYGSPYEVVYFVIKELLNKGDPPIALKHALQYIILHLNEVPNTFSDKYYADLQMLLGSNKFIEKLLLMIPDDVNVPEQSDLRDEMIVIIKQVEIDDILLGMNKYIYQKPIDLLIAVLARIEGRIRNKDIAYTVTKLLSILVLKKELNSFTETVPANVDVMTLLNFLKVPDIDPAISALVQKIQKYLDGNFELLKNVQDLIPKEDKSKCHRPIQCLLYILEKIMDPVTAKQLKIPLHLLLVIKKLHKLMEIAINNSAQCKPQDVTAAEDPNILHNTSDIMLELLLQHLEPIDQSVTLATPKPTEAHWYPVSTTPNDYEEDPDKPDDDSEKVIHPTHPDGEVEDDTTYTPYSIEEVTLPANWIGSGEINLFDAKTTESPILWSEPEPTQTNKVTSTPELIQSTISTIKPSVATSTTPPKKLTIKTTPNSYTTKQPPVDEGVNTSPPPSENEPVLPPNLKYDRPIYVIFPKDDGPPYTTIIKPTTIIDSVTVVSFPSIKELVQDLNPDTPFELSELPKIPEIMDPLKQILGVNFIEKILGKHVNKAVYPTVISLMDDLLDHALDNPKVMANLKLVRIIREYLKGIDYISTLALFPVVIDSQKISSDLLYVTFDPQHPNAYSVKSEPPKKIPSGYLMLPIYHPKYWIQQVDPVNPYGTLIPNLIEAKDNPIQDLIDDGLLQQVLGPHFDPFIFPNKGTLLTTILQKVMVSPRIKSKVWLIRKLDAYLKCIRMIAMYTKIPKDYSSHLVELQQNNEVHWQPDTESLLVALPPAENQHELQMIELIQYFLTTPNLLELLHIPNPSYSTTRGTLLKMIFNATIRGKKLVLDPKTLSALKHFESKILTKGRGALPIVWIWVQMFIIREEIPLGDIIEAVLDYDKLPYSVQLAYNDVLTYLSENPQFLQAENDFPYEKYPTKGTFLRGLFSHLMSKIGVAPEIKKDLKKLIPYVTLVNRGAEPMKHVTLDDITHQDIVQNGYSVMLNGY